MWETLQTLITELPPFALVLLVFALLGVGIYILTHARKDKNGHWYLYSRSYELSKNRQTKVLERLEEHIADDNGRRDKNEKLLTSIHMENLKQTVFLEQMPPADRLYAGLKYIQAGGNGDTKRYIIDNLVTKYKISYDTIITVHPELKIGYD